MLEKTKSMVIRVVPRLTYNIISLVRNTELEGALTNSIMLLTRK